MVWDSMFFGRIVQAGYEHEQFYAFFPLYPALVRVLSACGTSVVDRCFAAVEKLLGVIGPMVFLLHSWWYCAGVVQRCVDCRQRSCS